MLLLLAVTALVSAALSQRCVNLDSECTTWEGYCHLPEVSVRCPITCNTCPEGSVVTVEEVIAVLPIVPHLNCVDGNPACPDWRHLCVSHSGVQADCPATCGMCQIQSNYENGRVKFVPQPNLDLTWSNEDVALERARFRGGLVEVQAVIPQVITPLATEPTPECSDKYTACMSPFWLELCDTDAEVQADCPRACGLCDDQGPEVVEEEVVEEEVEETEAPIIETEAPVITTEAPVPTTEAPVITTEAPVYTTEARLETEAPVITDAPNYCEDRRPECVAAASAFNSICQLNAQVRNDCPKSCGLCPVLTPVVTEVPSSDCQDKYTACTAPFWLELCATNSGVQADCPRACGMCDDQGPEVEEVVEEEEYKPTEAPIIETEAPVITTEAPVITTEAPVPTTLPPVETEAPIVTDAPAECKDYYTACTAPFWLKLCATNTQVQHDCARSCGLCGDQEPYAVVVEEEEEEVENVYIDAPGADIEEEWVPVEEEEEEESDEGCEDKHSACSKPFWIEACDTNSGVQSDCPRSCGLCPDQAIIEVIEEVVEDRRERKRGRGRKNKKDCKDIYSDCTGLVNAGWCEYEMKPGHLGQYKLGIVSENCKKSCNLC